MSSKRARDAGWRAAAAAAVVLAGCTVTTAAGPLWSERHLAGPATAAPCVVAAGVTLAGADPWLEQEARRQWLALLRERERRCGADVRVRADVRALSVAVRRDLFGPAIDAETVPAPARTAVVTAAEVVLRRCEDGAERVIPIGHTVWIPHTADPFLSDERAMAALREAVERDLQAFDAVLAGADCVARAPGAASAPATPAP